VVRSSRGLDDVAVARAVGAGPDGLGCLLLFASPATCNAEELARSLDRIHPGVPKAGGLVRGDVGAGVMCVGGAVHTSGAVGVALRGDVAVDVLVAQGCRPIGPVMEVTEAAGHVLLALDEAPALGVVRAVMDGLEPAERQLLQRHPMLGVAMDPSATALRRGDFLIRQLIGVDPRRGALAVGHALCAGDRVQLHARDASASIDDLAELLGRHRRAHPEAAGALLFSCLGRGEALYGRRGQDSGLITGAYPSLPVGGMFCAGELGPVHGRTFLHGFTAVVALFRAQEWS
jgi:small ligand-binding sensory domain FIST